MNPTKTIIAVTGMPGSGKAVASSLARTYGIPVFVCGDVVREEALTRKLPPTPENLGSLMLKIREEDGPDVVAERLIPKIKKIQSNTVVVEGLRSLSELQLLKDNFKVKLLAVHSPPDQRFQRLIRRGRSDDPKSLEEFVQRDHRELAVGVGAVIALADKLIVNDSTLGSFKQEISRFYKEVPT